MVKMNERRRGYSRTGRKIRRYSNGSADNPFERYSSERNNSQSAFRKALTIMTIMFFTAILAILLFANNKEFLDSKLGENSFISVLLSKLSMGNSSKEKPEFVLPFGLRRQNILLLGVDSNGADSDLWVGTRTDTIILLNIDPKTKTVNAISIPRDSKVYLPKGMGVQKINAAHAIGGVEMTVKTIEDTLGVHIDKYVMFHDEAVRAIVGALGGVDIYVEKNMRYNDNAGHLHINFEKGNHHLTEKDAVEYLRFRHDALGDIGRTQRQQWFLRGLLTDLKKPETIAKLPKVISVAHKYVKTDMSMYEMSQYAALAKGINMDNVEISMLPGAPNKHGYISYWILDPEKTQEVVDRLIYRNTVGEKKDSYSASIMSSPDKSVEAAQLKSALEKAGIEVRCSGTLRSAHSQFIAHSKYVTTNYYADLKKEVPEVKSRQFVYDPVSYMCAATDFTVVVAGENK
ncbi:MAG: LCP family protein [Muribaculaceae bacterium]|nr:LCP family protein [Muribaculaceae bacterium]